MDDYEFRRRAENILIDLALENTGWKKFLRRWPIHHEPLRNDAANLLRESGLKCFIEKDCQLVGD